jgi:hypothetical protein
MGCSGSWKRGFVSWELELVRWGKYTLIQDDSGGKFNILGGDSVGHCAKQVRMAIFIILNDYLDRVVTFYSYKKVKVKSLPGAFSTLRPRGPIVFLPQQVPAFIYRGATHHTDARDLYQRRPVGLNLQESHWDFLHAAKLGHGTFYFPSEGRHTEDFSDARKIRFHWPVC